MKNVYSISNQQTILKILIDMCSNLENNCLIRPTHFKDHFSFLSDSELSNILDILENKQLINIQYADFPESFNIYKLYITPQGYDYFPQVSFDNAAKWKERIWGFVSGSVFTSIVALIISLIH